MKNISKKSEDPAEVETSVLHYYILPIMTLQKIRQRADMHKENEVKLLKDLIRGLGTKKTENSIVAISKAAPVIKQIAQNYDNMLSIKKINTKHKRDHLRKIFRL